MGSLRRRVGFWVALGQMQFKDVLAPELSLGLLAGAAGSFLLVHYGDVASRIATVGDFLPLVAGLLGIVFAALALVVALFSDDYLRYLATLDGSKEGEGVLSFLRPFMVSIGFMIAVLLGSVAYRAAALHLPILVEQWGFGILTTFFVVAVLDVVSLARNVMMHGLARSKTSQISELDRQREQRRAANGR